MDTPNITNTEQSVQTSHKKQLTDVERMELILQNKNLTFEQMIYSYIERNYNSISMSRLNDIVTKLQHTYLQDKILDAENVISISKERSLYLKTYLEGNMYTTEEAAIEHLPIQIKHAEEILNQCRSIPTRY